MKLFFILPQRARRGAGEGIGVGLLFVSMCDFVRVCLGF